jgi:hypothetical protein
MTGRAAANDVDAVVAQFEGWLESVGRKRRVVGHLDDPEFSVAVFDDETPQEERAAV